MAKHRDIRLPRQTRDRSARRVATELRRLAGLDGTVDLPVTAQRVVARLRGTLVPYGGVPASEALVAADAVLERHGESGLRKFFDVRRRRTKTEGRTRQRRILTTFERITPGEEYGDEPERESGWHDEEGEPIRLDVYDHAEGVTIAQKAAAWLKGHTVAEASSSEFHPGIWYIGGYDTDYTTGVEERRDYHLHGFSHAEERAVFNEMVSRKGRHRR